MSGRTRPQRAAARSLLTRSRTSACCSNAIRSAAAIKPWVGRTQAVGHRVIPLDRINSATASRYSSASLIKSSMFHTRAAGSVSQSLWLHLGVSPKILVKTETLDGLRAGFRQALLPFCCQSLVNGLVSKIFNRFLPSRAGSLERASGIRVISPLKASKGGVPGAGYHDRLDIAKHVF